MVFNNFDPIPVFKPGLLQPPRSGGKKYSVLILDDDQATTLVIARTLMVADFDVRSGETRDSALAELKKVPLPDAIVLNPHMRELNGLRRKLVRCQ